jgi:hypothetical protein
MGISLAVLICLFLTFSVGSRDLKGPSDPDLPSGHLPFFYNRFPHLRTSDYVSPLPSGACWGYEPNCDVKNRFSRAACPGEDFAGWTRSRGEAEQLFYRQASVANCQKFDFSTVFT